MTLRGTAFIILWHDIAPEGEAEYHQWHSHQHMPERIGHRGFLRSRRGVNWNSDYQRYLTLYEGEELATFRSDEYARSLNRPTEWTQRVAPHFRNFLRMACAVRATTGLGVGGAIATFRLHLLPGVSEYEAYGALEPVIELLNRFPSATATHLGVARPEFSEQRTRETELRPEMAERAFDIVLIVEAIGLAELEREAPAMTEAIAAIGLGEVVPQCYDMAHLIEREPA